MKQENAVLTEERMHDHLKTWIQESDFEDIAARGFNSIRLPIGYWNVLDDPYNAYSPSNVSVSLGYIGT